MTEAPRPWLMGLRGTASASGECVALNADLLRFVDGEEVAPENVGSGISSCVGLRPSRTATRQCWSRN